MSNMQINKLIRRAGKTIPLLVLLGFLAVAKVNYPRVILARQLATQWTNVLYRHHVTLIKFHSFTDYHIQKISYAHDTEM